MARSAQTTTDSAKTPGAPQPGVRQIEVTWQASDGRVIASEWAEADEIAAPVLALVQRWLREMGPDDTLRIEQA